MNSKFRALLGGEQVLAPVWYDDTAGSLAVAVSFDLAQDLSVEDGAEFHAALAAGE